MTTRSTPHETHSLTFEQVATSVRSTIELTLNELIPATPASLYDPVRHILAAGGKRIRPLFTALCASALTDSADDSWKHAACAVELLHTFTLAHDDIMDNASSRRGMPTLHVKYSTNTAILSGDVIIALAIESLQRGQYGGLQEMLAEFALGFRLVCDGQALDVEFESRSNVSADDYLRMIDLKTAKVLELAAVLGAYAGGGKYVEELRAFAHHVGIAFQIQDDLLDLTADHAALGKRIGGDLLEGKRTYLYVSAIELQASATDEQRALTELVTSRSVRDSDIDSIRLAWQHMGVLEQAQRAVQLETRKAQEALDSLPETHGRAMHHSFSEMLLSRAH